MIKEKKQKAMEAAISLDLRQAKERKEIGINTSDLTDHIAKTQTKLNESYANQFEF